MVCQRLIVTRRGRPVMSVECATNSQSTNPNKNLFSSRSSFLLTRATRRHLCNSVVGRESIGASCYPTPIYWFTQRPSNITHFRCVLIAVLSFGYCEPISCNCRGVTRGEGSTIKHLVAPSSFTCRMVAMPPKLHPLAAARSSIHHASWLISTASRAAHHRRAKL